MQWNHFRQTQLDSYSGQPISADRFWASTGWDMSDMNNKWVLDIGCGAGRFAEIALSSGANVVALDYSSAVDACYKNLEHHDKLHVIQGDVYKLPFKFEQFDFVYSIGVLQHTPDVKSSFFALKDHVKAGGNLCVDYYWKRIRTMFHAKYIFRPITKRIPQDKLFAFLEKHISKLLFLSRLVGKIPLFGVFLKRLVPVADYKGIFNLNDRQLYEWALLDTFDNLSPEYDNPQSIKTAKKWFEDIDFENIEVFHSSHLVARGKKPYLSISSKE
jgi:SAM-dependent methyltransferase